MSEVQKVPVEIVSAEQMDRVRHQQAASRFLEVAIDEADAVLAQQSVLREKLFGPGAETIEGGGTCGGGVMAFREIIVGEELPDYL